MTKRYSNIFSSYFSGILKEDSKDIYFLLNFYLLNKYALDNHIIKKDRALPPIAFKDDGKKGYIAYITRIVKDILEHLFPGFEIFKPRNNFSYEIGGKNYFLRKIKFTTNEDKLRLSIQLYLLSRGVFNADVINAFQTLYRQTSPRAYLIKNRGAGLVLSFNREKCYAWNGIKQIIPVKDAIFAIVDKMPEIPSLMKTLVMLGFQNNRTRLTAKKKKDLASYIDGFTASSVPYSPLVSETITTAPILNHHSLSSYTLIHNYLNDSLSTLSAPLTNRFNMAKSAVMRLHPEEREGLSRTTFDDYMTIYAAPDTVQF